MKIIQKEMENSRLSVSFLIEAEQVHSSFLNRSNRQLNSNKIDQVAIEKIVMITVSSFLDHEEIEPITIPEVTDLKVNSDGSLCFSVAIEMAPTIEWQDFEKIDLTNNLFPQQVDPQDLLISMTAEIDVEIPEVMIEQRLEKLKAEEKLKISQDPIYNVLANFIRILEKSYRTIGVNRSQAQIRHEGLDVMLQTLSGDQQEVSQEFFYSLIKQLVSNYRTLPQDFDFQIEKIICDRKAETELMTTEERIEELFETYLGSLQMNEKDWLLENRKKATALIKMELLMDYVGKNENIKVTEEEVEKRYSDIQKACQEPLDLIKRKISRKQIVQTIIRENAQNIVVEYLQEKL